MERLQKIIANLGVTSRRKAEELIISGKVKVNGKIVTELGTKVNNTDLIEVNNEIINQEIKKVYYLLNKPSKVITSTKDEKRRPTVVSLIDTKERIYPVGRLDYDTTGLIILTNDGTLANILMHPKNNIPKTYLAKVKGIITKEDIINLKRGIIIEDRLVDTSNFKIKEKNYEKDTTLIEITIYEGRNHIIKKIFAKLNHPVLTLKRTQIAFLTLENLKVGEYRPLKIKEVKKLYSLK